MPVWSPFKCLPLFYVLIDTKLEYLRDVSFPTNHLSEFIFYKHIKFVIDYIYIWNCAHFHCIYYIIMKNTMMETAQDICGMSKGPCRHGKRDGGIRRLLKQ